MFKPTCDSVRVDSHGQQYVEVLGNFLLPCYLYPHSSNGYLVESKMKTPVDEAVHE